jgi:hypothetical protein
MTFYIGHHYNKFKDFNLLEMKEIPLILLPDFQENKIDDKTLKEYFFPSRIYLLDTYLQIKPDQEIFQKLDRLFEEWKLESSLKIDFSKLNMEMKGIESKLNQYMEDFFIDQIRRFPKLYRNSSEEIRSKKRILLSSPMEFVNASNKLKNDEEFIEELSTHKYFCFIFRHLPEKFRMNKKYIQICLSKTTKCFKYIPQYLIDRDFVLKMCEIHPKKIDLVFKFFPKKLFEDVELIIFMTKYESFEFHNLPMNLKTNISVVKAAFQNFPVNYIYFEEEFKSKMEFAKPFLQDFPQYFRHSIPDSIKSDKSCIQEFLENNSTVFYHLDLKLQKENFLIFVENCNEFTEIYTNKIPVDLKNDPNLMELCLKRNPKNIVFFSQNNEFFIHGIVDHLHAYMIDYLEILEGPFNQDSFHQWYFNQFPRIWFYLKERILSLKKFPQKFNSVHYLNKELEKLNFSNKDLIWRNIEMELNRFYLILFFDHLKIKNLNDIKFEFM